MSILWLFWYAIGAWLGFTAFRRSGYTPGQSLFWGGLIVGPMLGLFALFLLAFPLPAPGTALTFRKPAQCPSCRRPIARTALGCEACGWERYRAEVR